MLHSQAALERDRSWRSVKRGIVVRSGKGCALAASVQGYCHHLRKQAMGRGGDQAIASATAERARLAREQANLAEIKAAKMRGVLVEAAAVEAEWASVLRTVRAGMLAVPSRVAARLPHLTAHDIGEIDQEVRAVLTDVGGRGQPSSRSEDDRAEREQRTRTVK
jgi:terminase small subunit / prophage DNA-packing protein